MNFHEQLFQVEYYINETSNFNPTCPNCHDITHVTSFKHTLKRDNVKNGTARVKVEYLFPAKGRHGVCQL